jgi:cellulose synthase/poly-beta-1,6-N-acetylglucosamine synthase-like glycosyltransferase
VNWWVIALVLGVNLTLWTLVGALRAIDDTVRSRRRPGNSALPLPARDAAVQVEDVAILMAAHNEELVIGASLGRLRGMIPAANVHVVSDFSTDRTVELARAAGVNAVETPRNVGKAGALAYGIEHFGLLKRFRAVMILDADTELDPRYFEAALPLLDDPKVIAVAGCAHTRWQSHLGLMGNLIVCYRQRLYVLTQLFIKYGQTWRGISATHIVPGFASVYRTRALEQINVNPSGLVIEDFNMTFEVHAKQLGRVAFDPRARAYTQDPVRYRDYVKQLRRWSLGFWQTLRRHGIPRTRFALSLALTLVELLTSSLLFVALPVLIALHVVVDADPGVAAIPIVGPVFSFAAHVTFTGIAVAILLPDYLLTCVVAVLERRPRLLLAGLLFMPIKVTDAAITLYSLPRAWLERSNGHWVSPTRRAMPAAPPKGGDLVARGRTDPPDRLLARCRSEPEGATTK